MFAEALVGDAGLRPSHFTARDDAGCSPAFARSGARYRDARPVRSDLRACRGRLPRCGSRPRHLLLHDPPWRSRTRSRCGSIPTSAERAASGCDVFYKSRSFYAGGTFSGSGGRSVRDSRGSEVRFGPSSTPAMRRVEARRQSYFVIGACLFRLSASDGHTRPSSTLRHSRPGIRISK